MQWNKETTTKIMITFTEAEARWLKELVQYPIGTDMGRIPEPDPNGNHRRKLLEILEDALK
jgi:hypothetical protein